MITLAVGLLAVAALPPPGDPRWPATCTAAELAYCTGLHSAAEHLAARVAAKRAVLAVLGLPGLGPPALEPPSLELPGLEPSQRCWREVEIRRLPRHAPVVVLHGRVEQARRSAGLATPGLSLSHAGGHAAALAWLPGDRE